MFVAFEGWTDAGEAASGALRFLKVQGRYAHAHTFAGERYFDYQIARPVARLGADGVQRIDYPSVDLFRQRKNKVRGRIHLLIGPEPTRRWAQFSQAVLAQAKALDIDGIVFLGALLADAPHTRPVPIRSTSASAAVRAHYGAQISQHEGPIGYVTVLAHEAAAAGIPTMTLWASIPHYAHGAACPKAASAFLAQIERLAGIQIPHDDLDTESAIWESALDSLAESDEDLHRYIVDLEETHDAELLPTASGESIAAEIEDYLRLRDDPRWTRGD